MCNIGLDRCMMYFLFIYIIKIFFGISKNKSSLDSSILPKQDMQVLLEKVESTVPWTVLFAESCGT